MTVATSGLPLLCNHLLYFNRTWLETITQSFLLSLWFWADSTSIATLDSDLLQHFYALSLKGLPGTFSNRIFHPPVCLSVCHVLFCFSFSTNEWISMELYWYSIIWEYRNLTKPEFYLHRTQTLGPEFFLLICIVKYTLKTGIWKFWIPDKIAGPCIYNYT